MMPHHRLLVALGSLILWNAGGPGRAQEAASPMLAASRTRPADTRYDRDPLTRTGARRSAVVAAIDRVRGAVVDIHSERQVAPAVPDLYGALPAPSRVNGMGTGIVVDPRGYIVTNHHVIEDVSLLRVHLADGSKHLATVIARAPEVDLALLKIDPKGPLPVMPLGTAEDLMVGETVIAIGNAFGYEHTVSLGIVSALKRDVTLNKDLSYKSLIQTDASINPGNSGGPLLNIEGELVGVNVAIRAGAQNIGFAIPVDQMVEAVARMLRERNARNGSPGFLVRDRLDLSGRGPLRSVDIDLAEVEGPAHRAGLRPGDRLVRIGDVPIHCSYDVERSLLNRRAGETLPVVIRRDGRERRLDLQLAAAGHRPAGIVEMVWRKLGIQLSPAGADNVARVNPQLNGGLEVTMIQDDGPAARSGIRKGDILVGLHQWETLTLDNVRFVLNHPDLGSFQPLPFFILRDGQVRRGSLSEVK